MGETMPSFVQDVEFDSLVEDRLTRRLKVPKHLKIRLTKSMTMGKPRDLQKVITQIKEHQESDMP
jgi:hypothetical protein